MFVVLYTVHWYICVFMTCSTACCLHDTYGSMECMYICMYMYMYNMAGVWTHSVTWQLYGDIT